MRVISVADPASPVEVGFYNTPGYSDGVAVEGTVAYLADQSNLGLYDISDALGVERVPRSRTVL